MKKIKVFAVSVVLASWVLVLPIGVSPAAAEGFVVDPPVAIPCHLGYPKGI